MKPAAFEYHAPSTVAEAVGLLDSLADEEPKLLAGGQSLVPMMNLRMVMPGHIIDINRIAGLDQLVYRDGELGIGPLVRHADVEDSDVLRGALPLLQRAATHIGYRQIRTRGTVGGSVCHADPAAEWPLIMRLLDAEFDILGPEGGRVLRADEFFVYFFSTALAPAEMLTNIRVRVPRNPWGGGFAEFARKAGEFAIVAAAVVVEARQGLVERARIALAGAAQVPVRAAAAEEVMIGAALDDSGARARAAATAAEACDPPEDIHGSAWFRRRLIKVEVERALTEASSMAREA